MSSGIDYSKWDHFDDSSSSSSEDEQTPRVTRLDTPSTISTSPGGLIQVSKQQQSRSEKTSTEKKQTTTKTLDDYVEEWTFRGGALTLNQDDDDMNDNTPSTRLYWSQDRESVALRIQVSTTTKANEISVNVQGAVSVEDRYCATLTETKPTLNITYNKMILLEGELPFPVYLEDDSIVDWTLESVLSQRFLVITLQKAMPMPGMTIWWKRPLLQFEEIVLDSSTHESSSFQQAWAQAHEQFKEKIKETKQQQEV